MFQPAYVFGSTCFCVIGITGVNLTLYLLQLLQGYFHCVQKMVALDTKLWILIKILRLVRVMKATDFANPRLLCLVCFRNTIY